MLLLLADAVVLIHAAFILWVIGGVFLLRRHPRLRILQLSCVLYGLLIEIWPWVCPLTHIEDWLRARAGTSRYHESFIAHYGNALLYVTAPRWLLAALALCVLGYTVELNVRWGLSGRAASGPHP